MKNGRSLVKMQLLQNPLGTGGLLLFLMELAAQG